MRMSSRGTKCCEPFAGPGPWWLNEGAHPYVQTPDDDPAFLYQDLLLALDRERGINIGMPSAHAPLIDARGGGFLAPAAEGNPMLHYMLRIFGVGRANAIAKPRTEVVERK